MKKLIIYLVVIIILLYIGILFAIKNILPYSIIKPLKTTAIQSEINSINNGLLNNKYEKFSVTTKDSLKLSCLLTKSDNDSAKGTIIILHGITNHKESLIERAKMFNTMGYDCVLFDSRAHGNSDGKYCTYGYYEKYDVSTIIDTILAKKGNKHLIAINGSSLGGAISIQAMAYDKRIRCGIVESSFATLRETSYDYCSQLFYIKFNLIVDKALEQAEQIAKFKIESVNPEESAKLITQPILIIHGLDDKKISYHYSERIFKNIKSSNKELYLVQNAGHLDVAEKGGLGFKMKIVNFLANNL